jgi:uncharacterized metal-binding protein YceD (DUF177 family)
MWDDMKINLEGLKIGQHTCRFLLDNSFFSDLPYSLYEEGDITVLLRLEKSSRLYDAHFEFKGTLLATCDKCGEDFNLPVHFFQETIVKFGDENDEDEGLIILASKTQEWELEHFLYETLILNLPARIIHPEDEGELACNPEVIKRLQGFEENKTENDPRWDILKQLKNN